MKSIESILIALGCALEHESMQSHKIEELSVHLGCSEQKKSGEYVEISLFRYFHENKEEEYDYESYEDWAKDMIDKPCPICTELLGVIEERKRIRRRISSLRGSITKRAKLLYGTCCKDPA